MKAMLFRFHTLHHKLWVLYYVSGFALKLLWRGILHDYSKFSTFEARGFGEELPKLRESSYGEADYHALLEHTQPILTHHYRYNRHHPEHFPDGYTNMSLLDIVEMLCDWQASVKKHQDGDIVKSIDYCQQRFGMSDDISNILRNTVIKNQKGS